MKPQAVWQLLCNAALVGSGARALPDMHATLAGQASEDSPQQDLLSPFLQQILSGDQTEQLASNGAVPKMDTETFSLAKPMPHTPPSSSEQKILRAAGVLAWAQEVGRMPLTDALALPAASAPNLQVTASAAQSACLQQIFSEDLFTCLPAWLKLAAQARCAVDPAFLPRLLDLGRQQVTLRAPLAAVLDQRGLWLAQLNPSWKWLSQQAHANLGQAIPQAWWQDGSLEQRCSWLRAQRQHDPHAARQQLQDVFSQEKASTRVSLLACLAHGLVAEDEAFLEAALDDRAKAVREQAAQLLARLPGSAWRQRMRLRVSACLHLSQGKEAGSWLGRMAQGVKKTLLTAAAPQLQVELPAACDSTMQRDGIEPKPPVGTGERGWWLAQMLALLPAQEWCAETVEIEILFASFEKSEWRDLLLKASQQSCQLHQDAALAYLLLLDGDMSFNLFRIIPAEQQQQLLQNTLQQMLQQPAAIRQKLPAYQDIFDAPDFIWRKEISQAFLQVLLAGVMEAKHEHESHHLRHRLLHTAPLLDLPTLQTWWASLDEWERSRFATFGTQNLPEKLQQMIAFREKLHAAFNAQTESN